MNFPFYYFIILGLITGVSSGLFGIGGGLVMVPLLVFYFNLAQIQANATSLVAMLLPVGLLGVWKYYQKGILQIEQIKWGLWIAIGILIGTLVGAELALILPTKWLSRAFSLLLLTGAIKLWLYSLG